MDPMEGTEAPSKEGRGRQAKTVAITINLAISDHAIMSNLQIKKMRQTGEDVPRERIISEALQSLAKALSSQE